MKVVVVDDDRLVTTSLKIILESNSDIEVVATGTSGKEAIELYDKYIPDILLMDIRMDNMNGIEAGSQILSKHTDAKILYLTTFSDSEYIAQALKMGAKGYMLKQNYDSIAPSIKAVQFGQRVFGDEIVSANNSVIIGNNKKDILQKAKQYDISDKELEIITYISDGLSNKEIAEKIFLSEGTVRNYMSNILVKLNLRDRTQIAIFYYRNLI